MVATRAQLQQSYLSKSGATPPLPLPPPIIGGRNNTGGGTGTNANRKFYQPLSDGPEGTIKMVKVYKKAETRC